MERKLVQQGQSTLMVSLPSTWIRDNDLKKGDAVSLSEEQGDLLISMVNKNVKTKVAVSSSHPFIAKAIILNGYRKGHTILALSLADAKQAQLVEDICYHNILGFEVTKREGKECIIEALSEPELEQYDVILKKFFFSVKELYALYEERLSNSTSISLAEITSLEERILKYVNFCRRLAGRKTGKRASFTNLLLNELNHAQRATFHSLITLQKSKFPSPALHPLIQTIKKMTQLIEQAYTEQQIDSLDLFPPLYETFTKEGERALLTEKKDLLALHHLLTAGRNVHHSVSSLVGLLV